MRVVKRLARTFLTVQGLLLLEFLVAGYGLQFLGAVGGVR